MPVGRGQKYASLALVALAFVLASFSASAPPTPGGCMLFKMALFRPLVLPRQQVATLLVSRSSGPPEMPSPEVVPSTWRITASTLANVTGDGQSEWVLVVWRPWRDWPIQSWSTAPRSPSRAFTTQRAKLPPSSCSILRDGREVWAGSALPAPILALAVGDVDGDGRSEVVTLEGD